MYQQQTSSIELYSSDYRQALSDFGVVSLIEKLEELTKTQWQRPEIEQLARLLIQQLINTLSYDWIDSYLNVIEKGQGHIISHLLSGNQYLPIPWDTPSFVLDAAKPMYAVGTVVRWRTFDEPELTDWGIVMGRFYGYAPENGRWMWCYLILLDIDAPSARWCVLDTAWEQDLERFEDE
ncbi:hypothetical protein [Gloeothece verrucosa]|uniref:Uncharacterized protein n=1 Tax=Gloeothece verrucosa (strain PCC 7822) TaxID=497965 RepID=E0UM13_GLOV7|nr:hypothetical protein [Gloeothece verrucosa]ADN17993.1 conserved hypothetical protein [Gloeothece verrucosa PCC 7822]